MVSLLPWTLVGLAAALRCDADAAGVGDVGVAIASYRSGTKMKALKEAGYSPASLYAPPTIEVWDLLRAFTLEELREAGFDAGGSPGVGPIVRSFVQEDVSITDLRRAGFAPAALYTPRKLLVQDLKLAWSLRELRGAGFGAGGSVGAGPVVDAYYGAVVTMPQLREAGYSPAELYSPPKVRLPALLEAWTLAELRGRGFARGGEPGMAPILMAYLNKNPLVTMRDVKLAGFSPVDAFDSSPDISVADLLPAWRLKDLRAAGFSAGQHPGVRPVEDAYHDGVVRLRALKTAGYTAADLSGVAEADLARVYGPE